MKRNSGGFTLVELIVVIVILGILAVTAAPKFMDLQGDARVASIKGLQGALNSAKSLVYGKALLNGLEKTAAKDDNKISVAGVDVKLAYGYPLATVTDIKNATDIDLGDTTDTSDTSSHDFVATASGDTLKLYLGNYHSDETTCYIVYTQATAADKPATVKLADGFTCD